MVWHKSEWRQRLTGRRLRWSVRSALVTAAPALRGRDHFYGVGVALGDVADRRLLSLEVRPPQPFSPAQAHFIERRCAVNDRGQGRYWENPTFRDDYFQVRGATMLGHTGCVAASDGAGLITEWGKPENWNRDKPGRLEDAPPLPGVALPVRLYTSNFHFLFDVALPLVAYLESGARVDASHTLVLTKGSAAFVARTAAALAAAYDLRVETLPAEARRPLESAVLWRRSRPCPDWYPVTRAGADRLRAVLAAHLPATLEGPEADLFLDRGAPKLRNLANADALRARLAAAGLRSFEPRAENFAEQVALPGRARRIVSVHGAALANLLFARPGARVVELFPEDACKSVYLAIAVMLGLDHRAVTGSRGDAKQHFSVDVEAVARALDEA